MPSFRCRYITKVVSTSAVPTDRPSVCGMTDERGMGEGSGSIFMMNITFNSRVIVHCIRTDSRDVQYLGFSLHMEMLTSVSLKVSP